MPYRITPFINNEFYHLYNRGLGGKDVFKQQRDYSHFEKTFFYYQIKNPKPKFSLYRRSKIFTLNPNLKIVEIICYCLMPNHFHLLVRQFEEGGITEFMRRFIHSYIKHVNTKYNQQGPLFQGIFKAVRVETDEQLIHLSRYIHLNPYVANIVNNLKLYPWSSYNTFMESGTDSPVNKQTILNFFRTPEDYRKFIDDRADYGRTLEILKHSLIDHE